MKDQILKIAKVKNEKEFYKKYPTEEAFLAKHGKAFQKAAMSKAMVNDQLHQLTDFGNLPIAQYGTTSDQSTKFEFKKPESFGAGAATAGMTALQNLDKIAGGISAIGEQKKAIKKADGSAQLAGLALTAQNTMQQPKRKYNRPEDALVQPGQLGDPYGSGTNFLAQNGRKLIDNSKFDIDSYGNIGQATRKIFENPNMSRDTAYGYQSPTSSMKYETNQGRPTAMVMMGDRRAMFNSSQPDSLAKYKELLSAPHGLDPVAGGRRLAGGKYQQGGEIQNTYAPGDLYDDLGYEPLNDSNVKQYAYGGDLPTAEFGEYFQDSGQAQIGSALGESIGSAFGPAGAAVGKFAGKVLGNALGGAKDARALQAQKDKTAMSQSQLAFQQNNGLGAFRKNGGWVSNDWQPQTFTKFGDYSAKQLLAPPHDADMLRAGGHLTEYTDPSEEAMFTGRPELQPLTMQQGGQMAMGGDLQVMEGGKAETISYNPFLPNGGETVMFKGRSHDDGGIPINYGENGVEVEGGEPATVLGNGGKENNMVVFGNMKLSKFAADETGLSKAIGKKYKHVAKEISKVENKQNKIIEKATDNANMTTGSSGFDKLSLNTSQAQLLGANMKLKSAAMVKQNLAAVQNAILDTASELGVKSDELAQGRLVKEKDPRMMAKYGKNLKKAQSGDYQYFNPKEEEEYTMEDLSSVSSTSLPAYDYSSTFGNIDEGGASSILNTPGSKLLKGLKSVGKGIGKGIEKYGPTALSNLENFLRPSNANEDLPPDQLYPEYYALATNQLDPVKAQTFQPMLDSPMDISYNDQLNAIDSQGRAAIRAVGQNPAAQAIIMSQIADAKNRVLGEQTRVNAANKMQTYNKNRELLNQAQLQNLQILDQQYVRQAQAKSNTKAQTQAALSSIAAKTAQQRAANRKLAIMENLYGFRFSPSGRVYNVNSPQQFNLSGAGGAGKNSSYTALNSMLGKNKRITTDPTTGEVVGIRTLTKDEMAGGTSSLSEIDSYLDQKNGGKTSKTKARNSSIVKALKNL